MNKALIVVALAAVTFAETFLGALIVGNGLGDLNASVIELAAISAGGAALSVIVNGLGKLHSFLAARNG